MVICSLTMRERTRLPGVAALVFLTFMPSVVLVRPAAAATPQAAGGPEPRDGADAKTLFLHGGELFAQKRFAEALEALEKSYQLQPSPNSHLLIARCLRELGRLVEALEHFQVTENEARARMTAGESKKYRDTQEAAATEGSEVRERLGTIHVLVTRAPEGSIVEVDGKPTELPAGGALDVLHSTGQAVIVVRPPTGASQTRTVQVVAGGESSVTLEVSAPPPPPEKDLSKDRRPTRLDKAPDVVPPRPRPWAAPLAIVSGGIGLVGFGLFAGFGLHSQGIYKDLKSSCAPLCGKADAEEGAREQTIANASLGVGIAGAVAAAVFTGLTLSASPPKSNPRPSRRLDLTVGLSGATMRGAF